MRSSRLAFLTSALAIANVVSVRGREIVLIGHSDVDDFCPIQPDAYDAPFRQRTAVQPVKEITQSDRDRIAAAAAKRARKGAKLMRGSA